MGVGELARNGGAVVVAHLRDPGYFADRFQLFLPLAINTAVIVLFFWESLRKCLPVVLERSSHFQQRRDQPAHVRPRADHEFRDLQDGRAPAPGGSGREMDRLSQPLFCAADQGDGRADLQRHESRAGPSVSAPARRRGRERVHLQSLRQHRLRTSARRPARCGRGRPGPSRHVHPLPAAGFPGPAGLRISLRRFPAGLARGGQPTGSRSSRKSGGGTSGFIPGSG